MRLRKSLEKNIQMKLSLTEHFNQEWQGSILLNILATVTLIFIFDILTLCTVKSELYMIEKKTIISCKKKKKERAKGGKKKSEI